MLATEIGRLDADVIEAERDAVAAGDLAQERVLAAKLARERALVAYFIEGEVVRRGEAPAADNDTDIIGLPESLHLAGIAKSTRLTSADVARVLFAVAHSDMSVADALIAWQAREQLRAMRAAKARSDARAAALAAAARRAEAG